MVMRTIEIKEISFEVEPERQQEAITRIRQLYPTLAVEIKNSTVSVRGDLHNYKRRNMLVWILTGGKHGKSLPPN